MRRNSTSPGEVLQPGDNPSLMHSRANQAKHGGRHIPCGLTAAAERYNEKKRGRGWELKPQGQSLAAQPGLEQPQAQKSPACAGLLGYHDATMVDGFPVRASTFSQ